MDIHSRFPIETINALKEANVLSAGVAEYLGEMGLNIIELGNICQILARSCSSSAMVLGMHYIKVSSIGHYAKGHEQLETYLRILVKEQRLVSSVASEEGVTCVTVLPLSKVRVRALH